MARLVADGAQAVELAKNKLNYLLNERGELRAWTHDDSGRKAQCALWQTQHGPWVVLDFTGHDVSVQGLRVADSKIVRENETIRIGSLNVRFQEIERFVVMAGTEWLAPDEYGEKLECPRCFRLFEDSIGEEVVVCPVCNTIQHLTCWQEHDSGGCNNCNYQKNITST